nr:ribonuclease H-like domain-containing protein [Tanacetum cinerariifolium]
MDLNASHIVAALKVPMLKLGEFELWRIRIEQYIQMMDYSLWDIIENGNSILKTQTINNVKTVIPPITADEKLQRRDEVKARSTLMMGLNEHQIKFNSFKDAKSLLAAIEKRFGGRKLNMTGNDCVAFDKTKVECYNCHKRGYLTREYQAPRGQDNRSRDVTRKIVLVETLNPSALKFEQINKIDSIDSEEIENFLNDDSIPIGVENSVFNMDEDILFLKRLLKSHVEFNFVESTSNHDIVKIDNLDEFSRPLIPIHIAEEERIRREHADYINRMEMLFTINPRPHPPVNANTNVESISSLLIPVQDSDSQREEIDIVISTDDVLPQGVENDDSDGEVDAVDDLRIDNSISNSEHESSESEDSDFDNPLVPLPPPEPLGKELDFEINFGDEILVVRNTIVKFECLNPRDKLNDDDFSISKMFISFFSAESKDTIFDPDSQMHNNIMTAGSRDRPSMLTPGRYPQWRSWFLHYVNTRLNGEALRKCILSGPYKPTTVLVHVVKATDNSLAVPEHTTVETPSNMTPENKAHFLAEKEAIHLILTGIGDDIYSTVDACQTAQEMWEAIKRLQQVNELRAEKLARNANSLALVATAQASQDPFYQSSRSHRSQALSSKPSIPTRSQTPTRHKGKEIAKPITPPSEIASEEDNDPEQAQRDKDMQKNLALIIKYFKKIYKPTNNNLRTSSNSKNKNVDTTPRKPKKVMDSTYHKEKMLLYKQAVQGVPLQVEQYDWLVDTDEEVDEQALEAHYNYMAKIQEVPNADLGTDSDLVEQVQNDAGYNVFANELQHSEQFESVSNTCLVETGDSNVTPNSPDVCEDDIQNEQNDVESDDERVELANLISNLKLDVDENKKIQKQLKKANTSLAQELKECKAIFAKTSKSLGVSFSV